MSDPGPAGELVDHLAEDGTVLGSVTRRTMRHGNLLHGAVFIAVVNERLELAVHQRAPWKDLWPSWWDLAFGGVPLTELREWIGGRDVCPDSVAIVVPLLDALP